jgi:hypothetical protein
MSRPAEDFVFSFRAPTPEEGRFLYLGNLFTAYEAAWRQYVADWREGERINPDEGLTQEEIHLRHRVFP